MMIMMNDTCTMKVSKGVASVVNFDQICDATIWSVNLTTLDLSFTIVICLYYRPMFHGELFLLLLTGEEKLVLCHLVES
jgi:hypothetical protein